MAMMMERLATADTPKATQYIVDGWRPYMKMSLNSEKVSDHDKY